MYLTDDIWLLLVELIDYSTKVTKSPENWSNRYSGKWKKEQYFYFFLVIS